MGDLMFQFLIGKVQLKQMQLLTLILAAIFMFQFLIGKVQQEDII